MAGPPEFLGTWMAHASGPSQQKDTASAALRSNDGTPQSSAAIGAGQRNTTSGVPCTGNNEARASPVQPQHSAGWHDDASRRWRTHAAGRRCPAPGAPTQRGVAEKVDGHHDCDEGPRRRRDRAQDDGAATAPGPARWRTARRETPSGGARQDSLLRCAAQERTRSRHMPQSRSVPWGPASLGETLVRRAG